MYNTTLNGQGSFSDTLLYVALVIGGLLTILVPFMVW